DSEDPSGGMSGKGGVSALGKANPYDGGWSDQDQWDLNDAIENGWNPSSTLEALEHLGVHVILEKFGHWIGIGNAGGIGAFALPFEDDMGGQSPGAQENRNHSGHGGGSGSSSSGGSGGSASVSGI